MVIQWKLVDLVDFLCGELNHNESAVRIDLSSAERQSEEREKHRHTHTTTMNSYLYFALRFAAAKIGIN